MKNGIEVIRDTAFQGPAFGERWDCNGWQTLQRQMHILNI